MKENTVLRFVNCTNTGVDVLTPQEIRKITPINDKEGKPHLMVDYYDDEFCLNCTLFCEGIEFETKEVENI